MITVIILGYAALIYLVFKTIKIRFGPVSIPAAVLAGLVFMILGTVLWKMSAPMTDQAFLRRKILIVSPDVQEMVSKVHVKSNDLVKKGDPLFEIRPDRFQDAMDQAESELAAAKSSVSQAQANVTASEAAVKQEAAETAAAKAQFDTAEALATADSGAIAKVKLEQARQTWLADQAEDNVQEALLTQARLSLSTAEHSVGVAQAGYDLAKFNLERCTYRSTVDGQVINFQVTEGTPTARYRFTSIGTVQDLSDTAIHAVFPQNQIKNVKAGDNVEIAFKSRPGKIATGKVDLVVNYTGEGQFMASLLVPIAADVGSRGYLAVRIRLDDEELARQLPLGADGSVAIYTDRGKPMHILSKISLRIKSLKNYMPF